MRLFPFCCLAVLVLSGCNSPAPTPEQTGPSRSPTSALIRGELTADEYLNAITKANEEDRANEQFELNKEPTRAYNTKTQRFEYVPEGTTQRWNEDTKRWEFTPID
jgi:hypothetical protein